MQRNFYSSSIPEFFNIPKEQILGILTTNNPFTLEQTQRDAWLKEIVILKNVLINRAGYIYFEYSIPRMGKRIDVVLIIGPVIFVLEFKIGEKEFTSAGIDQVFDYALDLKNFHETSSSCYIAPIFIATKAKSFVETISTTQQNDKVLFPIRCNTDTLPQILDDVLAFAAGEPDIDAVKWQQGRYSPTPTIIEAALALYRGHSVDEISRNDASAINLSHTADAISKVIQTSKENNCKSICFVTGVPGAGKTLVGLNTATKHHDKDDKLYSVFLSGNGPLVAVLREALARDHVENERNEGRKLRKGEARSKVKAFIQNVHNFRDECLIDITRPPIEHVAIFDEAQRAWNMFETASFMLRKKNTPNFSQSEPEFLISCLNRHDDWAVVVCLVGGGQEINRGEAGIDEWIESLERSFPDWHVYVSSQVN